MAVDPLAVAIYGFIQRERRYEEAGIYWEARLIRHQCTLEKRCVKEHAENGIENGKESSPNGKEDEEVIRTELFDADNERYTKYLMKLDSNDIQEQDHYKVLGLSKLRHEATMAEIRAAYRQKVLKHHPDKKKAKGVAIPNEEYYVCITKAFEQLGVSDQKRRAFDSVDKVFDDAIPSASSVNKDTFFTLLQPVFERNKRWSNIQPVPGLGDEKSEREHVEHFYNFWFEWNSWREFSYLDEEDKEKGEDRWERREMEKVNKAERERRRKDEMKRIRKLIELAYAKDPRIVQFKKDDQAAKERAKAEKQRAAREKVAEEERKRREEEDEKKRIKEEEERKAKEEKEAEKARKQEMKKLMAVQRRRLKKMADEHKYWVDESDLLPQMERVERICLSLDLDAITALCDRVEAMSVAEDVNTAFDTVEQRILAEELQPEIPICPDEADGKKMEVKAAKSEERADKENQEKKIVWSSDENALLIKATNLYPAGTINRWSVIAEYLQEHRKDKSGRPKPEKEVIKQAKLVQALGLQAVGNVTAASCVVPAPEASWSTDEQKKLEDALRAVPAADAERWNKIAEAVGTKTKKECITRYKYIVELVKKNKNGTAV